jgi:hypothetical protein
MKHSFVIFSYFPQHQQQQHQVWFDFFLSLVIESMFSIPVPPTVTDVERNILIHVSGALASLRAALPNTAGVNTAYTSVIFELGILITQTSKIARKFFLSNLNFILLQLRLLVS